MDNETIQATFNAIAQIPYVGSAFLITGFLYWGLVALRPIVFAIVKLTKTPTDNAVVTRLYAFLDKFSFAKKPLIDFIEHYKKVGRM